MSNGFDFLIYKADAAEMIGCSRQNIDDLIKRDRINPVKVSVKTSCFYATISLSMN